MIVYIPVYSTYFSETNSIDDFNNEIIGCYKENLEALSALIEFVCFNDILLDSLNRTNNYNVDELYDFINRIKEKCKTITEFEIYCYENSIEEYKYGQDWIIKVNIHRLI